MLLWVHLKLVVLTTIAVLLLKLLIPADGWECYGALAPEPSLDNTLWFAFVGDGNTYDIITTDCGGGLTNYIDDGDTQMSIYTGSCGALDASFL